MNFNDQSRSCHAERVSRSPERSEGEAPHCSLSGESFIPVRSALSLEMQARHEETVTDDQHIHNKPKKVHNYADFLINGHDDYTAYAHTLYRC